MEGGLMTHKVENVNRSTPSERDGTANLDLRALIQRLDRIESRIEAILLQHNVKDFYTVAEAAAILGKRPFTVRMWCLRHRIVARKADHGRGRSLDWLISHEEIERVRNQGLLPEQNPTLARG